MLLAAAPAGSLAAQRSPLVIQGRLLRIHGDTSALAGQWVIAHRVGERVQGPIDSQRTDAAGRFRFVVARPESAAVYVVSSRWQGIGYFSEPAPTGALPGPARPLDLAVFDTVAAGPPLHLAIRHLVITRGTAGQRRVLDIFQVENQEAATRVGRDSTAAVWSAALPEGIQTPQAGESDITASAIRFEGGRVVVSAPFPPGPKQVVINYDLRPGTARLAVPVDQPTDRLEILVEDSTATASGEFTPDEPIAIEGRTFRRYAADSVRAGARPYVTFSAAAGTGRDWTWLAVAVAALSLAGAALWAWRRRPPFTVAAGTAPAADAGLAGESDERLIAQIAALDDRFAGRESVTPDEQWRNYRERRAALKAELERRVAQHPPR